MRKIALVLLVIVIMVSGFIIFINIPPDQEEALDLEEITVLRNPVLIDNGKILIPSQVIFEELGAVTVFNPEDNILSAAIGDFMIELPLESGEATIDGQAVKWEIPIRKYRGIIYIPARSFASALQDYVVWDENTRTAMVTVAGNFDPENNFSGDGPILHIAYPPDSPFTYYGNSLFVFGTTNSFSQIDVTVNDEPVEILDSRTGNFLTMVDIPRGEYFPLVFKAIGPDGITTVEKSVIYPDWWEAMPPDPLAFHPTRKTPRENQVLRTGDILHIAFQGSPGGEASFQIGNNSSSYDMVERLFPSGPPGRGGIYTATYTVKEEDSPAAGISTAQQITVTLKKEGKEVSTMLPETVAFLSGPLYSVIEIYPEHVLKNSGWLYHIQDETLQLLSSTTGGTGHPANAVRYLVEGTRFEAVGISGDFYRVNIGAQTYLINQAVAREIGDIYALEPSLSSIEIADTRTSVRVRLITSERFPFFVRDGTNRLEVELYGLDPVDTLTISELTDTVKDLTLKPGTGDKTDSFILTVDLNFNLAGFKTDWEGSELVVSLFKQKPVVNRNSPLEGKTIIVDPGHGGRDTGAIGPGDIHEKDVVLAMSHYLRDFLEDNGAKVIMTRVDDSFVNLYDRPERIDDYDADFFISIHVNAHAHNAPATDIHGIMILYNYAHNEKLADIMLNKMVEETGLPRFRTWRRNIAVIRHPHVPSVLIEAGYMMHPDDNWYILHPRGQKQIARSMMEGIKEYFLTLEE